jgi:DnaJ-domain-containing protein 1
METQDYTDRKEYEKARAIFESQLAAYFSLVFDWENSREKSSSARWWFCGGLVLFCVMEAVWLADETFSFSLAEAVVAASVIGLWRFDKFVLKKRRAEAFRRDYPRPKFAAVKPIWKGEPFEDAREQTRREQRARSQNTESHYGLPDSPLARSARILGLKGKITKKEIKKQYRELLMRYHPDKAATQEPNVREFAEQKTKELNEAYEVLEKYHGF